MSRFVVIVDVCMLVLHIGFAKSGTTFLQKQIFPKLQDVNFLGRYYSEDAEAPQIKGGLSNNWVYKFTFFPNVSVQAAAQELVEIIDPNYRVNLLSHEVFLRPFQRLRLLNRLKELEKYTGEVKLLISIRSQTDLVLSRYVHDLETGVFGFYKMNEVLDFRGVSECGWPVCAEGMRKCACRLANKKVINMPYYNYLSMVYLISSILGPDKVHLIVSEQLRQNLEGEISRLTQFLGSSTDAKALATQVADTKENEQGNKELYDFCRQQYAKELRPKVKSFYSETNKRLSRLINVDLEALGYF